MSVAVIGRNGSEYMATMIAPDLAIVGKFICTIEDGRVIRTVCRATRANVAKFTK